MMLFAEAMLTNIFQKQTIEFEPVTNSKACTVIWIQADIMSTTLLSDRNHNSGNYVSHKTSSLSGLEVATQHLVCEQLALSTNWHS